jgi:3-hydroxyacyl-CoA dehydrogenase
LNRIRAQKRIAWLSTNSSQRSWLHGIPRLVGTGLVGCAWAISFARAGHQVRPFDESAALAEKAIAFAAQVRQLLAGEDLLDGQSPGEVGARLRIVDSLEVALDGAIHVQESTPEDLDVKKRVLSNLARIASPETVLASSTSAILPSLFTEALARRKPCLVVHPINPS